MGTQPTTPAEALEFRVDRDRCIGCQACTDAFPQFFELEGDQAVARPGGAKILRPLSILRCCPVDAITLATDAARSAGEAVKCLPIVDGWEAVWETVRQRPEDVEERERRYGRVWILTPVLGGWRWRLELPRGIPNSRWFVMHGIANEPPEYDFTVASIGPQSLSVRAWLTDAKLRFLAGKTNSFPNAFRADADFPTPICASFCRFDGSAIEVYAFPNGTVDPTAALRQAMLSVRAR